MHNRKSKILLLVLSAAMLSGCNLGGDKHTHVYGAEYVFDNTNHWKVCSKEDCDEIKEDSKSAHTMGEWAVTTEATTSSEGVETRTCTTCKYSETRKIEKLHAHTFDTSKWEKDATNHWRAATCEHTSEKGDLAAHTFGDWSVVTPATTTAQGSKKRNCTVCNYEETGII